MDPQRLHANKRISFDDTVRLIGKPLRIERMPAMMGGFAKQFSINEAFNPETIYDRSINKDFSPESIEYRPHSSKLGPYLAGLIEGDGSFWISSKLKKNPQIKICFAKKDEPLALLLIKTLSVGKMKYPKGQFVNLIISDQVGLYKIVMLINGYMRTPKKEALDRLIEYLNSNCLEYIRNTVGVEVKSLIPMKLDSSPIISNYWLAGFIDADGSFTTVLTNRNDIKYKSPQVRIQAAFQLSQRVTYPKSSNNSDNSFYGTTYIDIMSHIANYLGTNVYIKRTHLSQQYFYAYSIMANSKFSQDRIRNYLDSYILLSSKRNDYIDWCKMIDFARDLTIPKEVRLEYCKRLKGQVNKARTKFDWSHHHRPWSLIRTFIIIYDGFYWQTSWKL